MSLAADALAMCVQSPTTVPVRYGATSGFGFFTVESVEFMDEAGLRQIDKRRGLLVASGAFEDLAAFQAITLGTLGAATAAGGRSYQIRNVDDERQDGFVELVLVRA